MASGVEFLSTVEAARVLGVTGQYVRSVCDVRALTRIARRLVDLDSLDG